MFACTTVKSSNAQSCFSVESYLHVCTCMSNFLLAFFTPLTSYGVLHVWTVCLTQVEKSCCCFVTVYIYMLLEMSLYINVGISSDAKNYEVSCKIEQCLSHSVFITVAFGKLRPILTANGHVGTIPMLESLSTLWYSIQNRYEYIINVLSPTCVCVHTWLTTTK